MTDQDLTAIQPLNLLRNEAIGDLSGLKGAYYHFVYTLHLLLNREAQEVTFYAGNDLRVRPPVELDQGSVTGILATGADHDRWIQLKNTDAEQPWTPHRILSEETLLLTLILNALHSQYSQRGWSARLVSPAPIRSKEIRNFLADTADKKVLNQLFEGRVIDAYWRWNEWLQERNIEPRVGIDHVRDVAKRVLRQVADSPVVPLAQIADRIHISMLEVFHDATAASLNALALRGALMDLGAAATAEPATVSITWLERQTRLSLRPQDLLGIDPALASDAQVERHTPDRWDEALCVPRQDLLMELARFAESDRTLFVLTGDSGAGKSWASAYYAQRVLRGGIRVLISGSLVPEAHSLAGLVGAAFRALARPAASDEEIVRLVSGAASARGPFVLIADDIPLTGDAEGFARTLERLCQEARAVGTKLIVVARRSVWQRLASPRHLAPFLFRRTADLDAKPQYSYELTALTDAEMQAVLERCLPSTAASRRLALRLRTPPFAPLRNPYLLSVYMDLIRTAPDLAQTQGTENLNVDSLLDGEIERRFQEAARRAGCDYSEIVDAKNVLVPHLWRERRTGSRPADLVRLIEESVPGVGRQVLTALQAADVLTPLGDLRTAQGTTTYANPQFGDRLAALWLAQQALDASKMPADVDPGLDDGTMTALVRGAIDARTVDVITWAQEMLGHDVRWLSALAQGLAQRREEGWRLLATLTAWANRKEPYSAANAMRALGGMAAWSPHARGWAADLYGDEEGSQCFKGEIAMGAALDVVPGWVRRRVSLRLRREVRRDTAFPADSKKRARFIRHALGPLQHTSNAAAAAVAHSLLTWLTIHYCPSRPFGDRDVREQFEHEVDAIWGQIALYGRDADLQALLTDLVADDWKVRIRAARALLPIAQERPERAGEALFAQARREREILPYLLRPLIHYTESHPDDLLDIIHATQALEQRGCGIALVLLGRIARTRPDRVRQILPEHLHASIGPDWRAVLSGGLALAWWQYAASIPDDVRARETLEALSVPDYTGVPDKFQAFAAHGAAVAVMAQIGADIAGVPEAVLEEDVFFHDLAMEIGLDVLYTDFRRVLERYSREIALHPLSSALIGRLTEAVRLYKAHEIHPIEDPFCEWQFRVAVVSSDCLASLSIHTPDAVPIVTGLPRDWPALRVCNVLLEAGVITDAVINLGCQICAQHAHVWGNVSRDRDRFINGLRVRGRLPQEYANLGSDTQTMWSDSEIARMDADVAADPEAVLDLLHTGITPANVIPFFWEWSTESPNWRVVLLGRVFRAAFRETNLGGNDCECLCGQILEAIDRLPSSPLKEEYRLVYSTLKSFGSGEVVAVPEIEISDNFLSQSHHAALVIVRSFQQSIEINMEWFKSFLASQQGWAEDDGHWIFEGTVHSGNPARTSVYFPPALRIALTIASLRAGVPDLLVNWLDGRNHVYHTLNNGACSRVFRYGQFLQPEEQQEAAAAALKEVEALLAILPRDATVLQALGHLLLLLHRFDEAKDALEQCLQQPAHRPEIHIGARYNLACALARLGDENGSRRELTEALASNSAHGDRMRWNRQQVNDDPDFITVRESTWFQEAVASLPPSPVTQDGLTPPDGIANSGTGSEEVVNHQNDEAKP